MNDLSKRKWTRDLVSGMSGSLRAVGEEISKYKLDLVGV
jgi:hypothetical protein